MRYAPFEGALKTVTICKKCPRGKRIHETGRECTEFTCTIGCGHPESDHVQVDVCPQCDKPKPMVEVRVTY